MKYYAVRKGLVPGVYATWPECQAQVKGFPGAEYKSFPSLPEAEAYVAGTAGGTAMDDKAPALEYPYAFTDGSYNQRTGTTGWGGLLVVREGSEPIELSGGSREPGWAAMRNVAGEVLGCMDAVAKALELGLPRLHVYHDYTGVSCWPDGAWSANKPETREYRDYIAAARAEGIEIIFHKVKAHAGIPGNETADRLAKAAVGIS